MKIMTSQTINATIERVNLKCGGGHFIFSIDIRYEESTVQQTIPYIFGRRDNNTNRFIGSEFAIPLMCEIMKVVGVEDWNELTGQLIRIEYSHKEIYSIGNILKDDWIKFNTFLNNYIE